MFDATQDVEALDLLEAARTPQARSQLMESLCELIMRKVSFLMFQKVRCKTTILSCVNAVVSHDAALSSFPDIMLAGIVDLKPLHGRAIVAVEGDLIGAVVDELCGATSTDMYVREELSVLETRFGKQMIDITIAAISEVFANLVKLDGTVAQYETSRGMLSIDEAQAWMISATGIFESTLGFGSIKLIIPYATFETLETRINSRGALIAASEVDHKWTNTLDHLVDETPLEVQVEIARARVSIGVLDSLKEGDKLPFALFPEAIGVLGGIDMFVAEYGQSDGFVCCKLKSSRGEDGDAGATPALENRGRVQTLTRQKSIMQRITVALTVELGRVQLTLANLRQLREGQVLVLDQPVDEPLSIYANGRRFAYGEVAAIGNEQYGIRFLSLAEDFNPVEAMAA
ncbi:FliM/FliN family flagellar motor switch protein [Acidocella sp.]|jgi:flagellar motor switch protein FliM|uniref:FliM/FliN family flagellar motor switch protein n=1 Tax=Acidocella sp. TaxID=50710 RepID=UPI002F424C73